MPPHLDQEHLMAVARLFRVLSEPTRLAILQALRESPCSVNVLIEATGGKQANISKQLGILYDAGLLQRERQGNQVIYSIREAMIFDLCELVCDKLKRDAERQMASLRRLED